MFKDKFIQKPSHKCFCWKILQFSISHRKPSSGCLTRQSLTLELLSIYLKTKYDFHPDEPSTEKKCFFIQNKCILSLDFLEQLYAFAEWTFRNAPDWVVSVCTHPCPCVTTAQKHTEMSDALNYFQSAVIIKASPSIFFQRTEFIFHFKILIAF